MSRYKPLQMFDAVDPSGPVRDLPVTYAVIANGRPLQMFEPVDSSVRIDLPVTSVVAVPEKPLQMFEPVDPTISESIEVVVKESV